MISTENREKMVAALRRKGAWNKKERVEIACKCGCGESLITPDDNGRDRGYIANHQTKTLVLKRSRPYGPSPNIGRKASPETIEKLRVSHLGHKPWNNGMTGMMPPAWNKGKTGTSSHTLSTRKAISEKLSGSKSHLWRGGIPQRPGRTVTFEWRLLRDLVYERDNWICSVCKQHCRKRNIICHHIIPVRHGGADSMDNLATVCRGCHSKQEWLYGTVDYSWFSTVGLLSVKDSPRTVNSERMS